MYSTSSKFVPSLISVIEDMVVENFLDILYSNKKDDVSALGVV